MGHERAGALVAGQPLLTTARVGDAPGRVLGDAALPCAGLRVLDLTRVLAGPVATRTLALLGADVLRIDAPHLPESQEAHNDMGMGKPSATLDLGDTTDRGSSRSCSTRRTWWSPVTGRARWTGSG